MKRDWDVMRILLTAMESNPSALFQMVPDDFAPIDPETTAYHLRLLLEAGYIKGSDRNYPGIDPGQSFIASGLTYAGHDLHDTLASKSVWHTVLRIAREKGIKLTFAAVEILAEEAVRQVMR